MCPSVCENFRGRVYQKLSSHLLLLLLLQNIIFKCTKVGRYVNYIAFSHKFYHDDDDEAYGRSHCWAKAFPIQCHFCLSCAILLHQNQTSLVHLPIICTAFLILFCHLLATKKLSFPSTFHWFV